MTISSDFLSQPPNENSKETRRTLIFLLLALLFLIISASIGGFLFAGSAGLKPSSIISKIRSLTLAREKILQGEQDNRINILLLGMGGAGHDGATLTDTIIFTSIRPADGKVGMLSIPRDLNVLLANQEYHRVNTVNAFAELKQPGSGGQATAELISGILKQPIHYYLRVDFKAFEEIINTVGGVKVDIERSFYDPFYPDDNFGYAPVSFNAGKEQMDGQRALKFVRSRHGTNGEGNDFARARRQQKVIFALKERLLSLNVLLHPKRIRNIMEMLADNIQTNIAFWEGIRLGKLLRKVKVEQIVSRVLDSEPDGALRERNYNGAFVLEPKDETWGDIQTITADIFENNAPKPAAVSSQSPSSATFPKEEVAPALTMAGEDIFVESAMPLVELQNGTFISGLAGRVAAKLEDKKFNVVSLGNASIRDIKTTIVYDLTNGAKITEFEKLLNELQAIKGEGEPMHILIKGKLDFLAILGQNAIAY